ncbi:MAG: class I SAM-dependent methyltransferase [Methylococcaceae bacterium]|nr:class I SAM-dependent methyltransferase [Desulfuromonas sp.]NJD07237.1 class I SAM-dependent methyltransferase [Methylococcaceae bacterium]
METGLRTASDSQGNEFDLVPWQCPTCGPGPVKVLGLRGGPSHHRYRLGIESRIVQCRGCQLIFPDPFPVPKSPQALYGDPANYFEAHDLDGKIRNYRELIRSALAKAGKGTDAAILDVGSGRGDLLRAAQLEGVPGAVGLEFSEAMIDFAARNFGLTVLNQSIEEHAGQKPGFYDVVILNAVLEHVYDPGSMIAAASKLLKPGGVLYLDLPQEPNLLTRLGNALNRLRRCRSVLNLSPSWPPFHVYGFNRKSLSTLLEKHGVGIESIRIYANARVPSRFSRKDRAIAFVGTQIMRLANLTGTAGNMFVWARRTGASG